MTQIIGLSNLKLGSENYENKKNSCLEIGCKQATDICELTAKEEADILESAGLLINDFISRNILQYIEPNFHDMIKAETTSLLIKQLSFLGEYYENFDEIIESNIDNAFKIFYTHILPRRSYPYSFIRKPVNTKKMKDKIEYLKAIPQPEQRTDEWYLFRQKYITASSAHHIFGTQSAKNSFIYNKCQPINLDKYNNVSVETPMHWGVKYEPVSVLWYEYEYKLYVEDFGCLPHSTLPYLAASPDGIVTDETSTRFGRMLEIKNIYNREITGIPKKEYWIQMQLQMEVCDLNECDFLETRFIEYEDEDEFNSDGAFNLSNDDMYKGIIIQFLKNNSPHYEYPPFNITKEDFIKWEEDIMEKNANLTWIKNIYWKLETISCVLVLRNKKWFDKAKDELEAIWNIIQVEKNSDYSHRAPKKRIKKITGRKCLLNTNAIKLDPSFNNTNLSILEPDLVCEPKTGASPGADTGADAGADTGADTGADAMSKKKCTTKTKNKRKGKKQQETESNIISICTESLDDSIISP